MPAPKKKGKAGLIILGIGLTAVVACLLVFVFGILGGSTIKGKGYKIEFPESAGKVKCELASEEKMAEMNSSNYQFISRPVMVTQDGSEHVQLDQMAHVSFDIPKDIPEEEYINLMGVLITDDGPVFMIPEIEGIRKGVVSFETSHFSWAGATKMNDDYRREIFIERTAGGEWKANACDSDLESKVMESLTEVISDAGYGENDFMGIALREVLKDNSYIKDAVEVINEYDKTGGDPEAVATVAWEKIKDMAKAKALTLLFAKLQESKEVDLVDFSENTGKYKHTRVKMEGKYHDLVKELEKSFGKETMEKIGTMLGEGKSPAKVAWEVHKKLAEDRLKDFSTTMIPQIKIFQAEARVLKVIKKFWSSNEMIDLYNLYARNANSDGTMSPDEWNRLFFRRLNAAKSKYGLTEEQIRKQFEERYQNNRNIEKRKGELRKSIYLWESNRYQLTRMRIFDELRFDYIQRLTRIHMLVERFRKELLDKNGELPGKRSSITTEEALAEIVEKYLELYPDQQAFYEWLAEMGYMKSKVKKDADAMDENRGWWLIGYTIQIDEGSDGEHSVEYSASENVHKALRQWHGNEFLDPNDYETWYRPYVFTFTSIVDTPPEYIAGGDSIVVHASLKVSGGTNGWYYNADIKFMFDYEDVPKGFGRDRNWGKAINVVGSTTVGTRYGSPQSGEWDYVIHVPRGHKDELRAINYDSCGSRTHWIYAWCSIFEKEEYEVDEEFEEDEFEDEE